MADAPPSSGGLAVDPTAKVKKKAPRKPRSECTPEEIAKLDTESAKRRERRAAVKINAAAAKFAAQREELEATADEKEDLVNKAHAILMLGMGRLAGFHAAAVGPASTGSSVARPTHCQSPTSRAAPMSPGFPPPRHDGQTRFSASPDVGLFAPSTPRPAAVIDLNAFQSLEAFKARHNDKPFTLTHCWTLINNCPKFKDQYRELQRKRGKKTAKFTGGGDGEALKKPRGKTNSKVDEIRDATTMALHETLHGMMSHKDVRDEKKRQSKDEQMKQYLDLQRQKLEMEEAAKKRKIDMEEAARQRQLDMEEAARQRQLDIEADNVKARQRQLDIEATNATTKAKEVALAIMSVDLSKMSDKTRAWFEAKQKEMLDAEGLN
ncbi:hypothetical protein VPH35_086567 [Triticum aestivum]